MRGSGRTAPDERSEMRSTDPRVNADDVEATIRDAFREIRVKRLPSA